MGSEGNACGKFGWNLAPVGGDVADVTQGEPKADGQAELLARTMTFLSQAEPAALSWIFAQTDPAGLYSALREEGF